MTVPLIFLIVSLIVLILWLAVIDRKDAKAQFLYGIAVGALLFLLLSLEWWPSCFVTITSS